MSTGVEATAPRPIDPLAPARPTYVDDLVEVMNTVGTLPRRTLRTVRTEHFDISHQGHVVRVAHRVPLGQVHTGLSELLSREVFGPGWLRGADVFERIVTGIVLTSAEDPLDAWEHYYRTSLREIEAAVSLGDSPAAGLHGAIAGYAPVYAHAEGQLVGDSLLELGSSFGFFSLRQASTRTVTAIDVSPGSVRLLERVSARLGTPVETHVADAAHVPLPDGCADSVVALHLLEHVEPGHGWRIIDEAVRLARKRVIIAVPYEDVPEELWGHVRTLDSEDLRAYGQRTALPFSVQEQHGGWLVIDVD